VAVTPFTFFIPIVSSSVTKTVAISGFHLPTSAVRQKDLIAFQKYF
jgi:hypothetical protein